MDSLFNDEVIIKSQHRFRSDHHRVYTEEVNKITLSSNDDKRIQTFEKITTYPYGTNVFKACEDEMRYVILKKIILNLLTHVKEKSRNKSQALKNESQAHRNELQAHRFLKAIKNVYTQKTIKITIGRDVIMLKSQQLSNVCNARICIKGKKGFNYT